MTQSDPKVLDPSYHRLEDRIMKDRKMMSHGRMVVANIDNKFEEMPASFYVGEYILCVYNYIALHPQMIAVYISDIRYEIYT